ncbi:hypothetical protein IF650_14725 [Cellulosimicrobium terreum]|nr:hypothetical protein [Cellulosimicrobium terreum]
MPTATDRRVLVPGDWVRLAAAASLAVGGLVLGGLAAALFLLVLGGVMVPRALGLPPLLDVPYGVSLLVAAWAAQLEWYRAVPGLDLVVHAACTGLIAAVAYQALVRWGLVAGTDDAAPRRAGAGVVVATTALGALVAVLWEIGEWAGHSFLDDGISVGYTDTVTDLASGLVGAMVAGAFLARRRPEPDVRP